MNLQPQSQQIQSESDLTDANQHIKKLCDEFLSKYPE